MKFSLIYITTANPVEAKKIARVIIKENLAACANIYDSVTSIYKWEGEICENKESVVILKSTKSNSKKIINRVKELHSYECPCIVSIKIDGGNKKFLKWIKNSSLISF